MTLFPFRYILVADMYTTKSISNNRFSLRDMFNQSLGQPVLSNEELDEMLEKDLVPKEWQEFNVCFVGSVNVDEDQEPYINILYWHNQQWYKNREYLWIKKTNEHPLTPTIDEKRFNENYVVAIYDLIR